MKKDLPLLRDLIFSLIIVLVILFLSVKVDQFALGMMNPHHSIKFGLGVSLFVGSNFIAFLSIMKIIQTRLGKHFQVK